MGKKLTLFLYLLSIVFLILVLLIETKLVWADQPGNIQTDQDPQSPVSVDTNTLTLTNLTKDGSDYFIGPKYTFAFWRNHPYSKGSILNHPIYYDLDYCAVGNYMDNEDISKKNLYTYSMSPTQFLATLNFDQIRKLYPSCKPKVNDAWHFRLWSGGRFAIDTVNPVINDYTITFAQPNNTIVSIQPVPDSDVYIGEKPTILISNTVSGNRYAFWWDGDHTTVEWSNQNDNTTGKIFIGPQDNQPIKLSFEHPYIPNQNPSRTLCMGYGYNDLLIGLKCDNKIDFRFILNQVRSVPTPGVSQCTLIPSSDRPIPVNSAVQLQISNLPSGTTTVTAYAKDATDKIVSYISTQPPNSNNDVLLELLQKANPGIYSVTAYANNPDQGLCKPPITFTVEAGTGISPVDICKGKDSPACTSSGKDTSCDDGKGIKTAIGCIHTSPAGFIKDFLKFIIGLSGGLAFLLMLLGAFQMITSAGNPETLQAGRDRFQSAIIGLLFVIFAVLLLQIIGVGILDLGKQFGEP